MDDINEILEISKKSDKDNIRIPITKKTKRILFGIYSLLVISTIYLANFAGVNLSSRSYSEYETVAPILLIAIYPIFIIVDSIILKRILLNILKAISLPIIFCVIICQFSDYEDVVIHNTLAPIGYIILILIVKGFKRIFK